jgi:hypothetical protein
MRVKPFTDKERFRYAVVGEGRDYYDFDNLEEAIESADELDAVILDQLKENINVYSSTGYIRNNPESFR